MIEDLLFNVSEALKWPVLIAVLLALLVAIIEVGALLVELSRRRHRSVFALERAVETCRTYLAVGQRNEALAALLAVSSSRQMDEAIAGIFEQLGQPDAESRISKRLAEYDYLSLRRLERTRVLVRFGPALGLMGTLIPLAPGLAALGDGDVAQLAENLRDAFGATVVGLLVGTVAFALTLARTRMFTEDLAALEQGCEGRVAAPSPAGVSPPFSPAPPLERSGR